MLSQMESAIIDVALIVGSMIALAEMLVENMSWKLLTCLMLFVCLCPTISSFAQNEEKDAASDMKIRPIDELLLFYPTKYPDGDWKPDDLQFEDVWFSAEDKTRLHGWYCRSRDQNARATILIAHGNAGNVATRAPWLSILQSKLHVSAFMFDYRGYGRSQGSPSVEGAIQDAQAARKKLCELANIKDSEMILMGESLGGAVVVQLAAESAPRALILQSTFSSLKEVADVHFPMLSWLVPPSKLNSVSKIGMYHGPLLQSHGNADQTVPLASGQKLFQAANEPKEFMTISGADHNDWLTEEYLHKLDEFINRAGRNDN